MAVYDDQKDVLVDNDENSSLPKHLSDQETAAVEQTATDSDSSNEPDAAELEQAESQGFAKNNFDNNYTTNTPTKSVGDFIRKQLKGRMLPRPGRFIGGIIGFFAFGVISFFIFTITSGPMQFIHFAQYLQETHFYVEHYFLNNRLGKAIVYAGTNDNPQRRNLSYIGNKFADHYENRLKEAGITPDYERNGKTFRIQALKIDTRTTEGKRALDHMRSMGIDTSSLEARNGIVTIDINRDDLGNSSARFRRQAISGMLGSLELNGISAAMGSRLLKLRAGVDFHPFKNTVRNGDEKANDYIKRVREDMEKRIKYGVQYNTQTRVYADGGVDEDGNQTDASQESQQASQEASDLLGDVDENASNAKRASSIRSKVTAGYGITGLTAMVCAVQEIGNAAVDLSYQNVNLPLIRLGMNTVSMGSQVQSGLDVNTHEMKAVSESFYNAENNTSWVDAKSVKSNMGYETTDSDLDIPDAARPTTGDKPAFFSTIDNIINQFKMNTFCSAVTTTIGGWALTAFGIALTSTGPISAVLNTIAEVGQDRLVGAFLDDLVAWLASDQIDLDATGAVYGAYADYGSKLAANDTAISYGGTEMTDAEYAELKEEQSRVTAMQRSQQSVFARYLDMTNYHSLASTAMMQYVYPVNTASVGTIFSSTMKSFSRLSTNAASLLTPKSSAASGFDYGFNSYGFTLAEMDSKDYDDPFSNAKKVEPNLEELNDKYGGPCFNVNIDPDTYVFSTVSEDKDSDGNPMPATKRYDQIANACKDRGNKALTQYRFYIADTIAMLTAACYEGIEIPDRDPCAEIGLTSAVIGGTTSQQEPAAEGKEGWVWPILAKDASAINNGPCYGGSRVHAGMDINTSRSNVMAYAMHNGEVVSVQEPFSANISAPGSTAPAGNNVIVKADDGNYYWYQHLQPGIKVKQGQRVAAGVTEIGLIGKTGNVVLGSSVGHLHIVTATSGSNMGYYGNLGNSFDPMKVLPKPAPGGYKCYAS